ncbi:YlxR family protein [Arsenicicoccus piscis]|uniref:YlxR domain-containing protein n=1 Tax=Arsenicicoccus piscis TaxID=673954 RepID=A0ABQ6HMQ3_9MICO|nr:YlxR family protein [Arsenicicoccus piscis]MCH8627249.1 YlxR family protein [Arsenicicoccus piscis]GMA18769.1 hypothetical protein GCM10025862_07900 [Arsenicicoccus piscis]
MGCRGTADRAELVRVVRDEPTSTRLVVDPRRSRPGRGAWLHPDRACLDLAVRRKAFGRALRLPGVADHDALAAWFDQLETDSTSSTPSD